MIEVNPIACEGGTAIAITVLYPKTKLMSITVPDVGYIMCGVLNVEALDGLHPEREIIAARLEGIRTIQDLLDFPVREVTIKGQKIGIKPGISGSEAVRLMFAYKQEN